MNNKEPKHTPGPWHVEVSGSGLPDSVKKNDRGEPYREFAGVYAGDPHDRIANPSGPRKGVAHVYQGAGGVGSDRALAEQKANAFLIAAAPDLLAACDMIASTADSAAETGHTEAECVAANWDVIGPVVRAAIAKAEEQTQGRAASPKEELDWATEHARNRS